MAEIAPMDRHLRGLLRHGTFAQVLDHALNIRGLSLEQVRQRLAGRGVRVSRAALSYWRHGRSRPERAESLRAVRALEAVLGLPPESLVALLGPPRPRGRGAAAEPEAIDRNRLWPGHRPLLAELDLPPDNLVRRLDVHEHLRVDEHRRLTRVHTRLVVEATADRVDRCVVFLWAERSAPALPAEVRYCRPGRVRVDPEAGATVCELLLDQRLATGERSVIEYTALYPPGPELTFYHHRFTRPVRQYLLQAEFAGAPPATCVPFRQNSVLAPRRPGPPLWIGASRTAHLVLTDVRPGIAGLAWEWA
ncbi:transcriptional regulator [Amycolatopsis rubida]|uniref:Transcriptional regulator n=1 Tax=Amycolatopsis rubida TaxID=112413 RepID=A0A1I6A3H3_9PSEU|nr:MULTISPECIES: transcriptional regulator [Amycolatopsis]MYW89688.1 transcriptional regulator [Amycolatopsis rubida]NEC54664.1 transcriptional regulator [Amycolatopsis rubida]OAP23528.1 hypothetical protein A4R44_05726 [Amycolatopsis sp. M39]SFQ63215.1 hypothetical protein SAMN05421854_11772 [Amycolatopsis rubida]